MRTGDLLRVGPAATPMNEKTTDHCSLVPLTTRQWLVRQHQAIKHLLPRCGPRPLLTDDLVDCQGRPVDVFNHFHRNPARLQSVFFNFWGLLRSAQCGSQTAPTDQSSAPWPGFQEVAIPVSKTLQTYGWLGLARKGDSILQADCIVILPGLFGHNGVLRTRDLAQALIAAGYHVLAYENRGYGQTDRMHPDVPYTFGVLETPNLMIVSDWLEDLPSVRHTGLIGFCWSANQALLLSWYEHCPDDRSAITDRIAAHLPRLSKRPRYRAGIIAISPTPAFEEIIDKLETPQPLIQEPVLAAMQQTIYQRMISKHDPQPSGSLRQLIQNEFARSELHGPHALNDGLLLLSLLPHGDPPSASRLDCARMPVLIVHASNDPLANAHEIAELFATMKNPNIAAVMLNGGGHVGFAAYARAYYYSLIINFFDPQHGAAAMSVSSPKSLSRLRNCFTTVAQHGLRPHPNCSTVSIGEHRLPAGARVEIGDSAPAGSRCSPKSTRRGVRKSSQEAMKTIVSSPGL